KPGIPVRFRFWSAERNLAVPNAGKGRIQAVVVLLRDRIELVIVTAGAADRQPQKRLGCRGDHFVECVRPDLRRLGGILIADIVVGSSNQKRAADRNRGIVRGENIARQMLANELIERLVLVERTDDIVAERPQAADQKVALEAVALAESHDIQPVSAPPLAV